MAQLSAAEAAAQSAEAQLQQAQSEERQARAEEQQARTEEQQARTEEQQARAEEQQARAEEQQAQNEEQRAQAEEQQAIAEEQQAIAEERAAEEEARREAEAREQEEREQREREEQEKLEKLEGEEREEAERQLEERREEERLEEERQRQLNEDLEEQERQAQLEQDQEQLEQEMQDLDMEEAEHEEGLDEKDSEEFQDVASDVEADFEEGAAFEENEGEENEFQDVDSDVEADFDEDDKGGNDKENDDNFQDVDGDVEAEPDAEENVKEDNENENDYQDVDSDIEAEKEQEPIGSDLSKEPEAESELVKNFDSKGLEDMELKADTKLSALQWEKARDPIPATPKEKETSLRMFNLAKTFQQKLDIVKNGFPTSLVPNYVAGKPYTALNFRTCSKWFKFLDNKTGWQIGHKTPNDVLCESYNQSRKNGTLSDSQGILEYGYSEENTFYTKINSQGQITMLYKSNQLENPDAERPKQVDHSTLERILKNGKAGDHLFSRALKQKGGQINTSIKGLVKKIESGQHTNGVLKCVLTALLNSGEGYNKIACAVAIFNAMFLSKKMETNNPAPTLTQFSKNQFSSPIIPSIFSCI